MAACDASSKSKAHKIKDGDVEEHTCTHDSKDIVTVGSIAIPDAHAVMNAVGMNIQDLVDKKSDPQAFLYKFHNWVVCSLQVPDTSKYVNVVFLMNEGSPDSYMLKCYRDLFKLKTDSITSGSCDIQWRKDIYGVNCQFQASEECPCVSMRNVNCIGKNILDKIAIVKYHGKITIGFTFEQEIKALNTLKQQYEYSKTKRDNDCDFNA